VSSPDAVTELSAELHTFNHLVVLISMSGRCIRIIRRRARACDYESDETYLDRPEAGYAGVGAGNHSHEVDVECAARQRGYTSTVDVPN
jgi:hypothetical protein